MDKAQIANELEIRSHDCFIHAQRAMKGDGQAMWEAPFTDLAEALERLSDAVRAL